MLDKLGLGDLRFHREGNPVLSFFLMTVLSFFLFADQNLIAPNLKNIGRSLGLHTEQDINWYLGGLIPVSFFVLGGIVSLSMGVLSEKYPRKILLVSSILLGEIPCFLTGFAENYTQFFILRTLCGFGLGGVFPILFSMVGDYFSEKSRVTASAYVSLAMGLGVGIGQMAGGIFGESDPLNGWRQSFIWLSAPSFPIAAAYFLFCGEPKRGVFSSGNNEHKLNFSDIKNIFRNSTNRALLLQGIPGCVPWGVFFVYLVDFYETVYGLGKTASSLYVTLAGIGVMIGIILGGIIGQKLYNRSRRLQAVFAMSCILLGIVPAYFLIHGKWMSGTVFFPVLNLLTGIVLTLPLSNLRSILINVNPPHIRGSVFALYNLTDDLGKGFGPAISAVVLGLIPEKTAAFTVSILFWIPCALFWIGAVLNCEKDQDAAEASIRSVS